MYRAPSIIRGFTLIETIIYIGLFGVLMAGIIGTIYPFFVNSQRLSNGVSVEGETAFILHKIGYALAEGVTRASDIANTNDIVPNPGNTEGSLTIDDSQYFQFTHVGTQLLYTDDPTATAIPLNAERVEIIDFDVRHEGTTNQDDLNYIEVTIEARPKGSTDTTIIGPVRYQLHF